MLEKQLESKCRAIAKAEGGLLWKWVSPGNPGVPDRILFYQGAAALVEFKTPRGTVTKMQRHRHAQLEETGCHVHIVRTVEEFRALLASIPGACGHPVL